MRKREFNEEELEILRNNPYTYKATKTTLRLTREFKELFYKEYQRGKQPQEILEEYGYPSEVLGTKRISGISSLIRNEATRPQGFSEGSRVCVENMINAGETTEAVKHLKHRVDYLETQIEFLKKISSIKTSKR